MGRRRGRSARRQPWHGPLLKRPLGPFKRPLARLRLLVRWHPRGSQALLGRLERREVPFTRWHPGVQTGSTAELSGQEFKHLYEAIRLHSDGHTEAEPALRACWDADWLDLSRVGITPEPRHLCTVHGRQGERLRVAVRMGRGVHSGSRAYRDVAGADTWKPRGGLSGPTPAGPRATGLRAACR